MPYFAYVLLSDEGYHYTGHTADVDLRVKRHHLHTTHFTKKGTNWKMIYTREFASRSEAMKHEKWLKSGVGRRWLMNNVSEWSPPKAE